MNRTKDTLLNRWQFFLLAAFIVLCVIFGGSSRPDNPSMLILRPLSVVYLGVALSMPGRRDWSGLGWPLFFLGAFAATMAVQLIPLPPALWTALPGHARFTGAAVAAGLSQPWRPISLVPDSTVNSLLALLIPLAVLTGAATMSPQRRAHLIPVLLVVMIASAIIGIVQWAGGASSSLYFYRYTSRDLPVGLFANRNHQAVFLAMALPLLRVWVVLPSTLVRRAGTRAWLAGAIAALLFPVILATGSRSGFLLAIVGAVAALTIAPPNWRSLTRAAMISRRRLGVAGAVLAGITLLAGIMLLTGRAVSITRLSQIGQVEVDLRVRFLPIVLQMTREHLPFGSGYGTFEDLFHVYEPVWALKRTNFNHAHDDLIELAMTGGIAAILVLVAYAGFCAARVRAILVWGRRRASALPSMAGLTLLLMAFASSLTDYPVRTPAMAMLVALATAWLAAAPLPDTRNDRADRG